MNRIKEAVAALRYAPARDRLRLARAIVSLPQESFGSQPSVATNIEIDSLADLESGCLRLAAALGVPAKKPPAAHVRYLESLLQRGNVAPGVIGTSEWFFISAFVTVLAPARVVEIGTLTGFSAALLASAVIAQRGYDGRPVVETIDRATSCHTVPDAPVGFEIPRLLPEYPHAVRVHAGRESRIMGELFAPGDLDFAFIDGNHQHPSPLLDLLHLAPRLPPGGWLLLHDTLLGTTMDAMRARGEPVPYDAVYGAEWLFARWPFAKINGGNIGAVQLPHDRRALLPFALAMMHVPFERKPGSHGWLRKMLYSALADLL
jgi:predicted O-methyltransferase YrrM